jgi:uncharacterized membrane protein YdbT with pleckstrin-like domain
VAEQVLTASDECVSCTFAVSGVQGIASLGLVCVGVYVIAYILAFEYTMQRFFKFRYMQMIQ